VFYLYGPCVYMYLYSGGVRGTEMSDNAASDG